MSGTIVNLNKARKARDLAQRRQSADENRQRFGRTKTERTIDDDAQRRHQTTLDQARRETDTARRLDDNHDDLDPGTVS